MLFDFLDISAVNSKIVYDKIQSTAAMSSVDFRFSLARSMIGTFSNRKRAIPALRPSKRSKGEVAMVVDHLPQFVGTCARCAYCSLIKLENRTFIRCMKCHIPLCLQKEWLLLWTPYPTETYLKYYDRFERIFVFIIILLWRHLYSGWCEAEKYCFVYSVSLFNPNNFLNNLFKPITQHVMQDTISVLFSHFVTVISERDTSVPEVSWKLGVALKKMNKRFFLVPTLKKCKNFV